MEKEMRTWDQKGEQSCFPYHFYRAGFGPTPDHVLYFRCAPYKAYFSALLSEAGNLT
jgi:hypothetical protein